MADSIEAIVYDRLEMDGDLDDDAKLYVMAALDGTLGEVIEGGGEGRTAPRPETYPRRLPGPTCGECRFPGSGALARVRTWRWCPGPGLTLVVGANGTGKSSFAEGLEFLAHRPELALAGQVPPSGGRAGLNLHAQDPPEIQAVFAVDGETGDAVVSRRWQSADATSIEEHALEGLDSLEWESALDTHRPFLSYDQLSDIVDAPPSVRFDAMAAGLGLERLSEARDVLRGQFLYERRSHRAAREQRDELLAGLEALDDERAYKVRAALADEPWRLDRIHLVLEGVLEDEGQDGDDVPVGHRPLDLLQRLATIEFPTAEKVEDTCRKLRDMVPWLEAIRGRDAAGAALRHRALQAALHVHAYDGDQPCPACEAGQLDSRWKDAAEARLSDLAEEAEEANQAASHLHDLVDACETLTQGPPDWLAEAELVGIDALEVRRTWHAWERATTDEPGLPDPDQMWREIEPGSTQGHAVTVNVGNPAGGFTPTPSESTLTLSDQGLLQVAGRLTERGANARQALEEAARTGQGRVGPPRKPLATPSPPVVGMVASWPARAAGGGAK